MGSDGELGILPIYMRVDMDSDYMSPYNYMHHHMHFRGACDNAHRN